MEEKESDILESARKIFLRYGIRSVTMDDIAKELKISKKTLYKFVVDKPDLVMKVLKTELEHDKVAMEKVIAQSSNAIEEMILITETVGQRIKEIHPSVHFDLEKYYPEAWEMFNQHKKTFVLTTVMDNLKRGIKEGLYRSNLNAEIIARIYVSRVDMIFDGEIFPPAQFNFGEVYWEAVRYHIKGVASEKGLQYLSEKLKNEHITI